MITTKIFLMMLLKKLVYGKIGKKKLMVCKHTDLMKTKISKQYMIMHLHQWKQSLKHPIYLQLTLIWFKLNVWMKIVLHLMMKTKKILKIKKNQFNLKNLSYLLNKKIDSLEDLDPLKIIKETWKFQEIQIKGSDILIIDFFD